MKRIGHDKDVQIRQGKNLLGISYDVDLTNVTTRIMPTGEDKDGELLYLPELFIDSPYVGNYFQPKWMHLAVSEAKEVTSGDGKKTKAQCYEAMRNAVQAEYDAGCDLPTITLKVDFVLNDEGENIMTDLKLSLPDNAITDGFSMKFYYAQDADATTGSSSIDLTSSIASAIAGLTDSTTLITQTFDKASDWGLMITFGDAYESTTARADLARSFANMHLSGHDTGGVCFGGFSTATEGNPKLESHFPIYPYGGVEVVEGGVYEEQIPFDSGSKFVIRADNPLQPTLRCFGHVVELHGEIQPTASISGSTTYYPICTLPEKYAPHHDVTTLQQGTNQGIWMLRIFNRNHAETPCQVMFARYRSGSSWASVSSSTWLPFHATWIV